MGFVCGLRFWCTIEAPNGCKFCVWHILNAIKLVWERIDTAESKLNCNQFKMCELNILNNRSGGMNRYKDKKCY